MIIFIREKIKRKKKEKSFRRYGKFVVRINCKICCFQINVFDKVGKSFTLCNDKQLKKK